MPSNVHRVTATGEVVPPNFRGASSFCLQVGGVGGVPVSWTVALYISIGGTSWSEILRHTQEDGDGTIVYTVQRPVPVHHLKFNVISLVLGPASELEVSWSGS